MLWQTTFLLDLTRNMNRFLPVSLRMFLCLCICSLNPTCLSQESNLAFCVVYSLAQEDTRHWLGLPSSEHWLHWCWCWLDKYLASWRWSWLYTKSELRHGRLVMYLSHLKGLILFWYSWHQCSALSGILSCHLSHERSKKKGKGYDLQVSCSSFPPVELP